MFLRLAGWGNLSRFVSFIVYFLMFDILAQCQDILAIDAFVVDGIHVTADQVDAETTDSAVFGR